MKYDSLKLLESSWPVQAFYWDCFTPTLCSYQNSSVELHSELPSKPTVWYNPTIQHFLYPSRHAWLHLPHSEPISSVYMTCLPLTYGLLLGHWSAWSSGRLSPNHRYMLHLLFHCSANEYDLRRLQCFHWERRKYGHLINTLYQYTYVSTDLVKGTN